MASSINIAEMYYIQNNNYNIKPIDNHYTRSIINIFANCEDNYEHTQNYKSSTNTNINDNFISTIDIDTIDKMQYLKYGKK